MYPKRLSRRASLAAVLLVSLSMAGCATTMAPPVVSAAGRFTTATRLTDAQAMTTAPFDRARFGVVYVKYATGAPAMDRFFLDAVKATGAFDVVLDGEALQQRVIATSQATGGPAVFIDNTAGLFELSKTQGPFLIVEPSVEYIGGYDYAASLRATDASTGKVVFLARHKAFNWAGLDQPLFYPLLNAFIDWTHGVPPPAQAKRRS